MKKLRVLLLVDEAHIPPDSIDRLSEREITPIKAAYDVTQALRSLGHEVRPLGVGSELGAIRDAILDFQPDIAFNLLEEFGGLGTCVPYLLGYLELINQAYTGCNPRGLVLAENKALAKKILRHHRIAVPDFCTFPRGRRIRRPARLKFPLIVKSVTDHGSVGISQASLVHDDKKLAERVEFVHEQVRTDAIAEEYIEGRELYLGILGNQRLETFALWEMVFENLAEGAAPIATEKAKWDSSYQARSGIQTRAAADLPEGAADRIARLCKRAYRLLEQTGYARMDLRLAPDGRVCFLESNPNPDLDETDTFARSAKQSGVAYEALIGRILKLGLVRRAEEAD